MRESAEQAQLREFSRHLFGNRHKLEVLAGIADGGREFYVQALADDLRIPSQTVRSIVIGLDESLVMPLPRVGPPNAAHYHRRLDHPLWTLVQQLVTDLAAVS